jgi:hypothetical protein
MKTAMQPVHMRHAAATWLQKTLDRKQKGLPGMICATGRQL